MKAKVKQYFIYYKTADNFGLNFVAGIRTCKYPERTKQYKTIKGLLDIGTIEACGYCDRDYFEDYRENFVVSPIFKY